MNVHRTSLCFTYIKFLVEKILTWMYRRITKMEKKILKLPGPPIVVLGLTFLTEPNLSLATTRQVDDLKKKLSKKKN